MLWDAMRPGVLLNAVLFSLTSALRDSSRALHPSFPHELSIHLGKGLTNRNNSTLLVERARFV